MEPLRYILQLVIAPGILKVWIARAASGKLGKRMF